MCLAVDDNARLPAHGYDFRVASWLQAIAVSQARELGIVYRTGMIDESGDVASLGGVDAIIVVDSEQVARAYALLRVRDLAVIGQCETNALTNVLDDHFVCNEERLWVAASEHSLPGAMCSRAKRPQP